MGWAQRIRHLEAVHGKENKHQRRLYRFVNTMLKRDTYKHATVKEMQAKVQRTLEWMQSKASLNQLKSDERLLALEGRRNPDILKVLGDTLTDSQKQAELLAALKHHFEQAAADTTAKTVDGWRKKWFKKEIFDNSPGLWWIDDAWPENHLHLNIMSWNVLASSAVKYHTNGTEETLAQKKRRHRKLIDKMLAGNYDVVLLQEVDEAFVKALRKRVTRNFTRAPTYDIAFKLPLDKAVEEEDGVYLNRRETAQFGNAIMYNVKNGKLKPMGTTSKLIWNQDETVYDRKNALIMNFQWLNRPISFASLHLSGRNEAARERLLADILGHPTLKRRAVYGGDFNMVVGTDAYSTCSFDYDQERKPALIDKIEIATPETLVFTDYKILNLPCKKNFRFDKVGSDHFPVVAKVELAHPWVRPLDEGIILAPAPWNDILILPASKKKKKKKQDIGRLAMFGYIPEPKKRKKAKKKTEKKPAQSKRDVLMLGLARRRHAVAGEDDFAAGKK